MEDRIVIENLARFIDDRDRIPSMVDFKQGTVQATDNVSLGATIPLGAGLSGTSIIKNASVLNIAAVQGQSQDNWTYVPVTDVEDLIRTRCLYKYVIVQSLSPSTHRSSADWTEFWKHSCVLGGRSPVFGYGPPDEPWFIWRAMGSADDSKQLEADGYAPLGIFRSYELWAYLPSFHDFQLAVLGSIPNTAGAAGTGKASSPSTGQLTITSKTTQPKYALKVGETITINYTVVNSSATPLQNLKLVSTTTKLDPNCQTAAFSSIFTCTGNYVVTTDDEQRGICIEDVTTAAAQGSGDTLLSAAVKTKICKGVSPTVSSPVQKPISNFDAIYPQFMPGKSSGTTVAPLAPAIQ